MAILFYLVFTIKGYGHTLLFGFTIKGHGHTFLSVFYNKRVWPYPFIWFLQGHDVRNGPPYMAASDFHPAYVLLISCLFVWFSIQLTMSKGAGAMVSAEIAKGTKTGEDLPQPYCFDWKGMFIIRTFQFLPERWPPSSFCFFNFATSSAQGMLP